MDIPHDASPELRSLVDGFNPDAMTIEDLASACRRLERMKAEREPHCEGLLLYAQEKIKAMRARLSGNIQKAIEHEKTCDFVYSQLDAWQRW